MRRALIILLAGCLLLSACGRPADPATREAVWAALRPQALRHRLAPPFVYALVAAESNFDPAARHDDARGLLQLKPAAWRTVSREPYEPAVWDWRKNLAAGIDYLAWCRESLPEKKRFSYPLLLATYYYGPDYVEQHDFDLARMDPPDNPICRELWRGNLVPLPPPK